jgi:hypothetical protein
MPSQARLARKLPNPLAHARGSESAIHRYRAAAVSGPGSEFCKFHSSVYSPMEKESYCQ